MSDTPDTVDEAWTGENTDRASTTGSTCDGPAAVACSWLGPLKVSGAKGTATADTAVEDEIVRSSCLIRSPSEDAAVDEVAVASETVRIRTTSDDADELDEAGSG